MGPSSNGRSAVIFYALASVHSDTLRTATDLTFFIAGKPAFDIPLSHIHNTSINKTEVALEIARPENLLAAGAEMTSKRQRKLQAQDQLIELRLYIPGSEATARKRAKKAQKAEKAEASAAKGENGEVKAKKEVPPSRTARLRMPTLTIFKT